MPTRAIPLAGLMILAGCTAGTAPGAVGDYEVRIANGGAAELRGLVVYVSDRDSVRVGTLAPGASTGFSGAAAVHEHPYVRARVGGRERAAIPVEGFIPGFNPRLPVGRYVVTVVAGAGEHEI